MLRIVTLPVPLVPGVLTTREIDPREAARLIRTAWEADELASHVQFGSTSEILMAMAGAKIDRGRKTVPPPADGEEYLTVRLQADARSTPHESLGMMDFAFFHTVYRRHAQEA